MPARRWRQQTARVVLYLYLHMSKDTTLLTMAYSELRRNNVDTKTLSWVPRRLRSKQHWNWMMIHIYDHRLQCLIKKAAAPPSMTTIIPRSFKLRWRISQTVFRIQIGRHSSVKGG